MQKLDVFGPHNDRRADERTARVSSRTASSSPLILEIEVRKRPLVADQRPEMSNPQASVSLSSKNALS